MKTSFLFPLSIPKNYILGEIVFGGDVHEEDNYLAPTVVKNVTIHDSLMQESVRHHSHKYY